MARAGYIAPHKSTTSPRSARLRSATVTQDDIQRIRLQVLNQLTDMEYAQVVMKTESQVLVITREMDKQELGEELKAPWVDKYISEYLTAGDDF